MQRGVKAKRAGAGCEGETCKRGACSGASRRSVQVPSVKARGVHRRAGGISVSANMPMPCVLQFKSSNPPR